MVPFLKHLKHWPPKCLTQASPSQTNSISLGRRSHNQPEAAWQLINLASIMFDYCRT